MLEDATQFLRHAEKRKTGRFSLLESDQHNNVTFGNAILALYRTEERQFSDVIPFTEFLQFPAWDFDPDLFHIAIIANKRLQHLQPQPDHGEFRAGDAI
jgi:hypothetical protein